MNVMDKTESDDAWVASSCSLCYGSCSILAHRVDGVITKIEGNPDSSIGLGRLCAKGVSGLMTHYDPHRLKVPLRRTNPEKGIGIDPGWKEISWDEALDEIVEHLERIRADDPRKLMVARTTTLTSSRLPHQAFVGGFGAINTSSAGGGMHCGNGAHLVGGIMHASWSIVPDYTHCNYALYFGAAKGHAAGHAANPNMKMAADARARGMKMVVIDPFCNYAGAKATEWVPIRVGTDGALALALAQVMVNELGMIDQPYLKSKTNGTYLIAPGGRYKRDKETNKPLVWDEAAGTAKPFDEAEPEDMALMGAFSVDGEECKPSFALLAKHLENYSPEMAEEITTIPAANIRRIAKEFATEARIGSTIVIDGVTVPYRPAATVAFKGAQGHRNSLYNMIAIDLLNHLVGSADMAGGCLGFNSACHGYPETGRLRYAPSADKDGLMLTGAWMGPHGPYPVADPVSPEKIGLQDLFTMSFNTPMEAASDQEEVWDKLGLPYRAEMFINIGTNPVMSVGNKKSVAEALKRYKFVVNFDIFLTETSEFCDIVLPDCGYLQVNDSRSNFPFILSHPAGLGDWSWPIRQPIVGPDEGQREFANVLMELANRAGFRADMNAAFNAVLDLEGQNRLEGAGDYSYEDICDRDLRDKFGPEKGLSWFREHGVMSWPKKPEEVYWRHFEDVRVPIYWEWMPDLGAKTKAITDPAGLDIPEEFFRPLAEWLPCPSHNCNAEGFDFFAFYYRDTVHTNSLTLENAWLDEAAQMDPFSYNVALNEDAGLALGLKTGDKIQIENDKGASIKGRVRLTQTMHPEGLGIGACAGHWSEHMPVAKGKGIFFNDLLELDMAHASPANLNLDVCVKVKVSKATN